MSDETTETAGAEAPGVDPKTLREVREYDVPFPCATAEDQVFKITAPEGAKMLRVGLRAGKPRLWAQVHPDLEGGEARKRVESTFFIVREGEAYPEPAEYLGAFLVPDPGPHTTDWPEETAWHAFRVMGPVEGLMRSLGGGGLF